MVVRVSMTMLNVSIVGKVIGIFVNIRLFSDEVCVRIGVVQSVEECIGLALAAATNCVESRLTAALRLDTKTTAITFS